MTTDTLTDPKLAAAASAKARQASRQEVLTQLAAAIRHRTPEHRQRILKAAEQIPTGYLRTFARAMGARCFAAAIKAHCLECVCWNRNEVRLCTGVACALYPHRPYRQATDDCE